MNKISIYLSGEMIEFGIDKYKLFVGNNYLKKYELMRVLRQFFLKKKSTEYADYYDKKINIQFNNYDININDFLFFEICSKYGIMDEIKLGNRTLLLKFLETMLTDIEYNDLINTVNLLIYDINDNVINNAIKLEEDIEIKAVIQNLNYKTLLKILDVSFYKKGLLINENDLDYNEVINLQLDMIKKIASKLQDKRIIILLDLPLLTSEIFKKFHELQCIILCFCEQISKTVCFNINNVCYINNNINDLVYNEYLYNYIIMNLPFIITIDDLKNEIQNLIYNRFNDKNCEILKLL